MFKIESLEDIKDFVRGCTFMGTGGGGDPKDGIAWLSGALKEGFALTGVDASDIADDDWTACPFLMGSIAPLTDEAKKRMKHLGLVPKVKSIQAECVRLLEDYMDVKVKAVVAIELGGSNTAGCVAAAARLGISVVDGDYTGRAIPEVPQTTPYLEGLPLWPISSVDSYGNRCIINESVGYEMAERIGKFIAAASFGLAGQAGFLFKGKEMKRVLLGGTLSRCLEIGRIIRKTREEGKDSVREIVKKLGGWILMEGKVTKKEWEDREGYYWGTHTVTGENDFSGKEMRIWFKNENHFSWLNGKPYVASPDMIIVVNRKSGEPYMNASIEEGFNVAVIGIKAIERFRSKKGLDILGPGHFGFDSKYRPIEKLVEQ
jgi:DUF917 family protein